MLSSFALLIAWVIAIYIETPSRTKLSSFVLFISSALPKSSSASQLAQPNLPFRNPASGDASHTKKWPGNSASFDISNCSLLINNLIE